MICRSDAPLVWKTPWIESGLKNATLGTRSLNSKCFVWGVCQKTQDWLLWEAAMLSVILLRVCLLILMVGFVFQRSLACALQELSSFCSENTTSPMLCAVAQTYTPITCKSIKEHFFHIMFSFSTLGLGRGPAVCSASPHPQARQWWLSAPAELDLHCAAGTGVHWVGREAAACGSSGDWGFHTLPPLWCQQEQLRSPAYDSRLGGPSLDLRVVSWCKIWESEVQLNTAHLIKIKKFSPSTKQILNSLLYGVWTKDSGETNSSVVSPCCASGT